VEVRTAARVLHGGRVALGAALLLAPQRTARGWLGELAHRPGVQALVRSLGVRDLVLGMIALHTLDHPDVGPRWQTTVGVVDAVDALATGLAASDLPPRGVAATVGIAGGAAAAELWFARVLKRAG
jgi:hypothetical protein